MTKQIYVNLPVRDLQRATAFYQALGFEKNARFSDENASCLLWSEEIAVMLLADQFYQRFIPGKTVADATKVSEVLLCLNMDSREEVDEFVMVAVSNGGKLIENEVAAEYDDAMYVKDVQDLDGHVWELLYMDLSKYPS